MEEPRDEEGEAILIRAFLDQGVTLIHREEFSVVAEKSPVLLFKVGDNAKGREFGAVKLSAH